MRKKRLNDKALAGKRKQELMQFSGFRMLESNAFQALRFAGQFMS
jgi:hypothetical protein